MSASHTDPGADDPVSDDNVSDVPRSEHPPQEDTDEESDGDSDGDGDKSREGNKSGEGSKAGDGDEAEDEAKDGDKAGDGGTEKDGPDETGALGAPSAPSAAADASTQTDTALPIPNVSVLNTLLIGEIHPLLRVLIVAISGTLPTPADKWERPMWERSIGKNMLTIIQGSEKSGFSLNHEGFKCEFIYDTCGDAMIMKMRGEVYSEILVLSGILEQKKPWKAGDDNFYFLHPGSFRLIWTAPGQSQPTNELELRLLPPRYRIKKYRVRRGVAQPEVSLNQDPMLLRARL